MTVQRRLSTIAMAAMIFAPSSFAADGYSVLDAGASYQGKTVAQWTAAWWTWAWNSPAASDPLSDTTGALANQNNDGPVFFVAGSNANGPSERTFSVPQGKALLVPMINYWENCVGDIAVSCGPSYVANPGATLLANSEIYRGATTSIFVSIDGTPVANPALHWEVSDVFSGGVAQAGSTLTGLYAGFGIDIVGQDIYPSLVSGYYVLITGLSAGSHTVVYGGSTTAFGPFSYQVTANIDVTPVPEPESFVLMLSGLGLIGWAATRRGKKGSVNRAGDPRAADLVVGDPAGAWPRTP
jgi:hypothetical protein